MHFFTGITILSKIPTLHFWDHICGICGILYINAQGYNWLIFMSVYTVEIYIIILKYASHRLNYRLFILSRWCKLNIWIGNENNAVQWGNWRTGTTIPVQRCPWLKHSLLLHIMSRHKAFIPLASKNMCTWQVDLTIVIEIVNTEHTVLMLKIASLVLKR